jgi:hypothetical protein
VRNSSNIRGATIAIRRWHLRMRTLTVEQAGQSILYVRHSPPFIDIRRVAHRESRICLQDPLDYSLFVVLSLLRIDEEKKVQKSKSDLIDFVQRNSRFDLKNNLT